MKLTIETLLKDLQTIYEQAMAAEQLTVALKVKELQAKYGLEKSKERKIDLAELSDDDLEKLLQVLQNDLA